MAQDTLMVLHTKYGHVEQLEDLVRLSMRIVRNKVMGEREKSRRRGEYTAVSVEDLPLADPGEGQAARLEREDLLARMKAALKQMDPKCRELFRLRLRDMDFPAIQKELGAATINTVYTWDSRCRKRLLDLMASRAEGAK